MPTFTWTAVPGADHYYLYVLDTTTNQVAINRSSIAATSYATPNAEALTPGHSFVWYLFSFSTNGLAYNFATAGETFSLANLGAPILNSPIGAIAPSAGYDMPTFDWTAVPGADHYYLYVLDTTTNQVAINQSSVSGTSYTTSNAETLTPEHSFIWYVFAFSTNGLAYGYLPGQSFLLSPTV